ncbi:hypothetical protein VNO77_20526 [Canavalia gladiata]|uniref:Uncharacterized protein n=1 Tax=Canavalia gladiata TaxID=3824 RepID=A0AAN9LPE1_CANGL
MALTNSDTISVYPREMFKNRTKEGSKKHELALQYHLKSNVDWKTNNQFPLLTVSVACFLELIDLYILLLSNCPLLTNIPTLLLIFSILKQFLSFPSLHQTYIVKLKQYTILQLQATPIAVQMSRKSKRVCFSPDINDKPTIFLKHGGGGGDGGKISRNMKRITGIGSFRLPIDTKLSPIRFLVRLGAKVASAIRDVSVRRRSSRKVSSSTLVRSRSLSDLTDSHRAETVEDCIEFLHSSSSRERPS